MDRLRTPEVPTASAFFPLGLLFGRALELLEQLRLSHLRFGNFLCILGT